MHQRQNNQQCAKKEIQLLLHPLLFLSTGELGLPGGTKVNLTFKKLIKKKHKHIKPTALSPFLTGNKSLLNEDNDDNPETTYTSLSKKDDMSHTSPDTFTEKK